MIVLTGGTGFVGQQLLGRLLRSYPDEPLSMIVRSSREETAWSRARQACKDIFDKDEFDYQWTRIQVIDADLCHPNLGLEKPTFDALASETTKVFHCAASVSFTQSLEESRLANVSSTNNVLSLLRRAHQLGNHQTELHYLSTAYVAGDTERISYPQELSLNIPFKNTYEQTKAEAEALVREKSGEFYSVIYRPSIIVGDSVTGQTSTFNVIYGPARFFVRGILKVIPGHPNTLFDMIPVDYVVDAITNLSKKRLDSGKCFHICSGVGEEARLSELIEALFLAFNRFYSKTFPPPPFVAPELLVMLQQSLNLALEGVKTVEKFLGSRMDVLQKILPYFLYMHRNPRFEIADTNRSLEGLMYSPPHFKSYIGKLFEYCFDTEWGKLPWTNPCNLTHWSHR